MPVDWFRLIVSLETKGFSLRHQSEAAQVSPATIHYWKCGGEPRHSNGQMLIDFYTTKVSTAVPIQSTIKSR
tara:strand:+ start:2601 stop:2816 length:216 start_codon:yes stop_codon:yes gene_type:complete